MIKFEIHRLGAFTKNSKLLSIHMMVSLGETKWLSLGKKN